MNLTDEQQSILSLAPDPANLQIIAYAGCGKTSTLEALAKEIPGPKLYLAFNKRVADEAEKRMAGNAECRTFNSLGHRIWAGTVASKLVLNAKKTGELFREVVGEYKKDQRDAAWEEYSEIRTAVDMAKGLGYCPNACPSVKHQLIDGASFYEGLEDRLSLNGMNTCEEILRRSITAAYRGNIDYNDQLYMPALFGGSFPRFPTVLVDEAQDLSPVNHEMIRKLAKGSRLISVGDPFQSIYQFRGAMQDGMLRQRETFAMGTRQLSVSFRCPRAIVENARWRAPDFRWLHDGGAVRSLQSLELTAIAEDSAIICRNNAPLFALACRLLAAGRSCRVAGSDVGPKLIGILKRLGDESLARSAVLGAIDAWEARRGDSASAADLAACLRIFANLGDDLRSAISYAEHVLKQTGRVVLTTGHKAKGLEWKTVYHLDQWLIGKGEQELNLRYVIQTRAREAYYEIDSRDID